LIDLLEFVYLVNFINDQGSTPFPPNNNALVLTVIGVALILLGLHLRRICT
jgi:hypothetical protein